MGPTDACSRPRVERLQRECWGLLSAVRNFSYECLEAGVGFPRFRMSWSDCLARVLVSNLRVVLPVVRIILVVRSLSVCYVLFSHVCFCCLLFSYSWDRCQRGLGPTQFPPYSSKDRREVEGSLWPSGAVRASS